MRRRKRTLIALVVAAGIHVPAATADDTTVKMLSELATIHARTGDYDKAYIVSRKILELDPTNAVGLEIRGDTFISSALKAYRATGSQHPRINAKILRAEAVLREKGQP